MKILKNPANPANPGPDPNGRPGGHYYRNWLLAYSLIFAGIALLVFCPLFMNGRSMIWYTDGRMQHYPALMYYGKFLRGIFRNLFLEHRLAIPQWDLGIGEGSDILRTLHYYVIGDPLTLVSAFVPSQYTWILYHVLMVVRLYLAGLAFSWLCFGTGIHSRFAVILSSLAYCFCLFGVIHAAKHPCFLLPMFYLPLLILGFEKYLTKKKPALFVLAACFSSLSSFYFFYMLAILTAVYGIVRVVTCYKKRVGTGLLVLIRAALWALLGFAMSAAVSLPVDLTLFGDSRMSVHSEFSSLYPTSYYKTLPELFLSTYSMTWVTLGLTAVTLLGILYCVMTFRKHAFSLLLLAVCILFLALPIVGSVMNCFSYAANRWCFAVVLLCCYMEALALPGLLTLDKKRFWNMFLLLAVYTAVVVCVSPTHGARVRRVLVLAFAVLLTLAPVWKTIAAKLWAGHGIVRGQSGPVGSAVALVRILQVVLLVAVAGNLSYNAERYYIHRSGLEFFLTIDEAKTQYRQWEDQAVAQAAAEDQALAQTSAENRAFEQTSADSDGLPGRNVTDTADDMDFFRYAGNTDLSNSAMLGRMHSLKYYWTLANPRIIEYQDDLGIGYTTHELRGYGRGTVPNLLASVRYIENTESFQYEGRYALQDSAPRTYGKWNIYKARMSLPIAYGFDSYMTEDEWKKLSPVQRQEALVQTAVLSDTGSQTQDRSGESSQTPHIEIGDLALNSQEIPFAADSGDGVTYEDGAFKVSRENGTIVLHLARPAGADSELYMDISGFHFRQPGNDAVSVKIWAGAAGEESTKLSIRTSLNRYYRDRDNFTLMFRYADTDCSDLQLTFSVPGTYEMKSLKIVELPVGELEAVTSADDSVTEDPVANNGAAEESAASGPAESATEARNLADEARRIDVTSAKKIAVGTDKVTVEAEETSPEILCFSIPWSDGWSAKIDGEPAKVLRTDICHMGVEVSAGKHTIELAYERPYQKMGVLVSLAAWALALVLFFFSERTRRARRTGV